MLSLSCCAAQYFLLTKVSFFPMYVLGSFVKNQMSVPACAYFWIFYSIPWVCVSVFVPVPCCLKSDVVVFLSLFFLLRIALAVWGK
jgi:hypothetical protein